MYELTFSADKLAVLFNMSRRLNALIELEELLSAIMSETKQVLHAESCALLFWDEERHELCFPVVSDLSPEMETRLHELRFPADQGIAGWVLQQGQPAHVADVTQDARFYGAVDDWTGVRTRELLYAPLRTRRGVIGVIGVRNKCESVFTDDDLTFLDALAGPIAIALNNARLYQHVQHSEAQLQAEVATLHREREKRQRFTEIIGAGPVMDQVFALMESAIPTTITVLLQGESGTGKERIARAIHDHGPRKDRPFVAVNCGALSETLLESELFGHIKGAFTGASADKLGLFEVAHGGTLFLDEIGDTPLAMQAKLLRVLQEGEIQRVGDPRPRQVDVRIISATHRDLSQAMHQQHFRDDLYYRLNVFPITVPPLRQRPDDIPLLAAHFLRQSGEKLDKPIRSLSPEAVRLLRQYAWPGNVRELENEIERAVALAPAETPLGPTYFSDRLTTARSLRIALPPTAASLQAARLAFEQEYIGSVLQRYQGNATQAAKVLGISRQMLQRKIKQYGLRSRPVPSPADRKGNLPVNFV